jgi:menaquinone-specific isochorismate synthase
MRAVTTALERDIDLDDVARGDGMLFVRDGVGVAARGVAARIPLDGAVAFLAAIDHHDAVGGTAPIAIGSLPFEAHLSAELIVPRLTVVRAADGRRWVTRIVDEGDAGGAGGAQSVEADLATITALPRPQPAVASFSVAAVAPVEQYLGAVTAARDAVRRGELAKAVIAREVRVTSDRPIDVHAVLLRLRASFGSSHRYSIDGFIGASPELLVRVDGNIVESHPLAGTAPRTGDPATDARLAAELVASTKNQVEHRSAIDMVHDTLLPWCSYLDWEPEPSIVTVANVQHLGSRVEGWLSDPRPDVLELVRALLPTPALGGAPRAEALALIAAVEGFTRGRYGGAVGWVDGAGNGTWAVAIRCAELSHDHRSARLVAGGGIVAESDPLAELAETQAKLQAMLSAIVRP